MINNHKTTVRILGGHVYIQTDHGYEDVILTNLLYKLFEELVKQPPNTIIRYSDLEMHVYGSYLKKIGALRSERLEQTICRLRKRLKPYGIADQIQIIHGRGIQHTLFLEP